MAYEINVSKNGTHFFATDPRSIGYSKDKVKTLIESFKKVFPEDEGYRYSVTNWEHKGTAVELKEFLVNT